MIELADVISQLRQELDRAREAAEPEELRFELGPIDLEVTVGLDREVGAAGRIRFWVAELGADGRSATTTTQRIKLTLHPSLPASKAPQALTASAYVSGNELPGER